MLHLCLSPDLGGEHSLQWLPCGRLSGVPEARGICSQKRSAHINRSEPYMHVNAPAVHHNMKEHHLKAISLSPI